MSGLLAGVKSIERTGLMAKYKGRDRSLGLESSTSIAPLVPFLGSWTSVGCAYLCLFQLM